MMEMKRNPAVRDGDILLYNTAYDADRVPHIVVYPDTVRPDILDIGPSWMGDDRTDTWDWAFTFVGLEALRTLLPLFRAARNSEEFCRVFDQFEGESEGHVWPQIIDQHRFRPLRVVGHSDEADAIIGSKPKRGRRRGRPHRMRMPSPSLYLTTESEPA